MKKVGFVCLAVLLVAACTIKDGQIEWGVPAMEKPCILHTGQTFESFCADVAADDSRSSLLCQIETEYGVDPCVGYRVMELAAKEGALFEVYTQREFDEWADKGIELAKSGVTFNDIKVYGLAQVAKLNKLVGAQVMMMGDMLIYVDDSAMIGSDDALILEAVFIDLKAEVARMQIFVE
jgi:hypothetical protein